jgi:hypothetical protein
MTVTTQGAPNAEAGTRLDSMVAQTGVVSESQHQALRADIRLLSTLLCETLIRQGGEELLKLVEQVRSLAKAAAQESRALLATLDVGTAVQLARAFSAYFQLANVAEQLHRSREQRTLFGGCRGPLRTVINRLTRDVGKTEDERRPSNQADLRHHHEHPYPRETGPVCITGPALPTALPWVGRVSEWSRAEPVG